MNFDQISLYRNRRWDGGFAVAAIIICLAKIQRSSDRSGG